MIDIFRPHNLHWQSVELFKEQDPQLCNLPKQVFVHEPSLLKQLPTVIPGIYTVGGGRQIGKTTLLKQWMSVLLENGCNLKSLFFMTGELIADHINLIQIVQEYLNQQSSSNERVYLIIDEVTYIRNWDQGIKYLADIGAFENVIVVLTGSDLTFMQEARMRFPGRRGNADQVDFHLYPLSFYEFINLKLRNMDDIPIDMLFDEFELYIKHGGFLTAINCFAKLNTITPSVYRTYSDWIRGDIIKHGKSEAFLREVLLAIIKTYNTQVTWNSLAHHTSIDHPSTIQSYVHLLESMDVLYVQNALIEDKLLAAPKKAKKIIFKDPFIFHSICFWLSPAVSEDSNWVPSLVESCVVSLYQRTYPCFYIKAEGEVDLAYVDQNKFFPIEVKWTNQLRSKDLKQILKYPNALILSRMRTSGTLSDIPTEPLPLHLYELGKRSSAF